MTTRLIKTAWPLWAAMALAALQGCKGDEAVHSTFCNMPARLTVQNTFQAPALHNALNNMGEFCTVTTSTDGQRFVFKGSAKEPSYINIMADAAYSGYYLGLSGLIVGLPNIPEMGKDVPAVVCFDLACPNCYETYHVTKPIAMEDGGYGRCGSCKRTYNPNDNGIVASGTAGRNLYRYRVSYLGNTLVVNNR